MRADSNQTQNVETDAAITHLRSGLLIFAQTGEWSDPGSARSALARLREQAVRDGHADVCMAVAECEASLDSLMAEPRPASRSIYQVLDRVSSVEAAFLEISLHSDDFFDDLASLVEKTFREEASSIATDPKTESGSFAIDDETLDIFRTEASELLTSINLSVSKLLESPSDTQAIWEIRRCAHTFKGAAGIVGYKDGCVIAHRMEDLLDILVDSSKGAGQPVIDFLKAAVEALQSVLDETEGTDICTRLERSYLSALDWFSNEPAGPKAGAMTLAPSQTLSLGDVPEHPERAAASPVIRVTVERLENLMAISKKLAEHTSSLEEQFCNLADINDVLPAQVSQIRKLLGTASSLNEQLEVGLNRMRMVRFGTIETRLARAVNNTCTEVNKKAAFTIENADLEIDTVIIDSLVEPLIHLLKNAVVHGIEMPETRRLVGKSEAGRIVIKIDASPRCVTLSIHDDGGGISVSGLKQRAVEKGLLSAGAAREISDADAVNLIFEQGLTTADRIDLNAGRGVGMAIVKECVEARSGTLSVESRAQVGTTFRIELPNNCLANVKGENPDEAVPLKTLDPLVLIVDDSSTIRNQAVKIVEKAGFRTITANNGAEALELLLSGKWEPDLILSDVEMPQIDGWQLLEYLKTDDNLGEIPVVMITSLNQPRYRQRAFDLGASDYIAKPVRSFDLERVCRQFGLKA
jgi:CheY-like chemotaxis protein